MAVRRTREEKVRAQQRRTEMFSWQNQRTSVATSKSAHTKQPTSVPKLEYFSPTDTQFLRKDLLKTLFATFFVLSLLSLALWLS